MSISFNGNVYLVGTTKNSSHADEVRQMREYARKNDCDVVVLDRDYYMDDTGKYQTIVAEENETTGGNNLFSKIFDFKAVNPLNGKKTKLDIPNA